MQQPNSPFVMHFTGDVNQMLADSEVQLPPVHVSRIRLSFSPERPSGLCILKTTSSPWLYTSALDLFFRSVLVHLCHVHLRINDGFTMALQPS